MHSTSHRFARRLVFVCFVCIVGCEATAEPSAEDVYSVVLAEISSKLQLWPPILIHPLVGMLEQNEPMREFLVWDTAVVPAVVNRNPGVYRLCEVNAVGNCARSQEPWLILSEIKEVRTGAAVVVVMVRDPRVGRDAIQTYRTLVVYRSRTGMSVRIDRIP